jgi:isopentenyl phosphate kinase
VLARQICFAVSQIRYSSLIFDLEVAPVEKAAAIFDNNFESFRVFLEAFVPVAFAGVTTSEFADIHTYSIEGGDDLRRQFSARSSSELVIVAQPAAGDVLKATPTGTANITPARERAEWLWKLANGSLLIPVLLGLVVMLYAVRELSELQKRQQEQLKPILEHHLALLKEDRLQGNKRKIARRSSCS